AMHVALWGCWIIFGAYWYVSAGRAKPVARRQSRAAEWAWRIPIWVAAALLILAPFPPPDGFLFAPGRGSAWTGVAITTTGLAICIWARRTLGGNWSSAVSLKQGHELIQSGPYRFVRNPIYTGLILMFLGTACAVDRRSALLALALAIASYGIKLKQEEQVMQRQFPEAYARYRQRVKALIPFVF
ncbi:MAG: methyltransferase family protein, partial [Terriglobales bacterium]